jgi:hypothetical protein
MMPTQVRPSPTLVKAAVLLLSLAPLISVVQMFRGAHVLTKTPTDNQTLYERRFLELKKALPLHGVVGYITDENDEIPWNYYQTQYALSPIIVDKKTGQELVVGNFRDSAVARKVIANNDLILLKDFGEGVVLFRKQVK